jgi:hypothetical protein
MIGRCKYLFLSSPGVPMSAQVKGVINVMDTRRRIMKTKSGYWSDNWTQITLSN